MRLIVIPEEGGAINLAWFCRLSFGGSANICMPGKIIIKETMSSSQNEEHTMRPDETEADLGMT